MGWVSWAKEKAWGAVSATAKYTYGTVSHLFEQIGVLPKTIRSLLAHESSRTITNHLAYIISHDLLPLLLVNFANNYIQQSFSPEYDEEDSSWLSANYFIDCSLMLLGLAVKAYNFRQGTQMATRTILVSLRAADAFNQINPRERSPLCIEEKCTVAQQIKGSGRELVELMANDLAVHLISQIPGMSGVSYLVSIYVRGRYIAKSTTPERCPDHRALESEYALALGLGHEGMAMLLRAALTATSGLPPEFCLKTMEQMLLMFQIAIAAHLNPPLVRSGEQTIPVDPMDLYERFMGWWTKVVASGLKKQIPPLLQGPPSNIPWQTISNSLYKVAHHPLTRQLKYIILPPMFHSEDQFINDPIIKRDWETLMNRTDSVLAFIINKGNPEKSYTVKVAAWAPKSTAAAVKVVYGIPQFITKSLLIVVGEEVSLDYLRAVRNWVGELTIKVNANTEKKLLLPRAPDLRKNMEPSVISEVQDHLKRTSTNRNKKAEINPRLLLKKPKPTIDTTKLLPSRAKDSVVFFPSDSQLKKEPSPLNKNNLLKF